MTRLRHIAVALAAGGAGLALAASAAGTAPAGAKVRHLRQPIEALALDGTRLAYDAGSKYVTRPGVVNEVLVWDVATGRTTKVSGSLTAGADGSSTGAGVFDLAVAGTRVAWLTNVGGNTEGDDALFTSSVTSPQEHQVAAVQRLGDNCAGRDPHNCAGSWLGGLAGSGGVIAANRWTTGGRGSITTGGLYLLSGTKLTQIASGAATVEAVSADGGRLAVLRSNGTVGIYSSTGKALRTVTPTPRARQVALSGGSLVVLRFGGTLALYDASTGALEKTLAVHGSASTASNLGASGRIAVYTTGCGPYVSQSCPLGSIRAVDLKTGKDVQLATLAGGVNLAAFGRAGLAYAGNGWHSTAGNGTLVFLPYARVAAAVS